MMNPNFELEGELLDVTMKLDKLKKKSELTDEDKAKSEDLEKRKNILEKRLREVRMKGI
ncbi:MAG: hypothetical protein IKN12_08110 [Selenomonadaceae bacterium]|nr:hypothetical protein [Selenomonadaceae bacterium]MBR3722718.1 hypothetical protein [Selenomonadaceae bacterium]